MKGCPACNKSKGALGVLLDSVAYGLRLSKLSNGLFEISVFEHVEIERAHVAQRPPDEAVELLGWVA